VRLALLAEAEAELDDAATWYDDRSEGLGDGFMDVAREALALVVDSPETWPLWPRALARLPPIRRFDCHAFPMRSHIKHRFRPPGWTSCNAPRSATQSGSTCTRPPVAQFASTTKSGRCATPSPEITRAALPLAAA
jgi:hypothetical protein